MAWDYTCIECGRPMKYPWTYCSRGCERKAKEAGDYQKGMGCTGCLGYLGGGFVLLLVLADSKTDKNSPPSSSGATQQTQVAHQPKENSNSSFQTGFYKLPKPQQIEINGRRYRLMSIKSDDGITYELQTSTEKLSIKRSELPPGFFEGIN